MVAYCINCWTTELPWLDSGFRLDDVGVAEEDDDEEEEEEEEGFLEKPVVTECPGNEIDMASPQMFFG